MGEVDIKEDRREADFKKDMQEGENSNPSRLKLRGPNAQSEFYDPAKQGQTRDFFNGNHDLNKSF